MGRTVTMIDPDGGTYDVAEADVPVKVAQGYRVQSRGEEDARLKRAALDEAFGGAGGAFQAGALNVVSGATGGLSDMALRAAVPGAEEGLRHLEESHPYLSTGGQIAGSVLGAWGTGGSSLATGVGERAAAKLGGGALAKVGGAAIGAGIEGGVMGVGQGVHELALSEDPITFERAASTLSSNALYGSAFGAGAGAFGKAAELGIARAGRALNEAGDSMLARAVDTAAEGKQLADDLAVFRQGQKDSKLWLTTKQVEGEAKLPREVREIGKLSLDADRQIDRLLSNPKYLAEKPEMARAALQKQEHALELLVKQTDSMKQLYGPGERSTLLEQAPAALQANRTLQQRIVNLAEQKAGPSAGRTGGFGADLVRGETYGVARGAIGAIQGVLPGPLAALTGLAAPLAATKLAGMATDLVFGRLSKAGAEQMARTYKAVGNFLDTSSRYVGKHRTAAPIVATKVLSKLAYGPEPAEPKRGATLADHYKAREKEIREQTTFTPDGKSVMRQDARVAMAQRLAPVRAFAPMFADKMETLAAKRLEFLSSKLPRRPEVGAIQTGPDSWHPSDMEMRAFARYAAAVEDPHGVFERLADGSITPEDAEAVQEVYPELHADVTRQILTQLPTLRKQLPYQRRLALSVFSGVPVDPALDPRILPILQARFRSEPGTEGGTQMPTPQPQFGSIKNTDKPTPAQERSG